MSNKLKVKEVFFIEEDEGLTPKFLLEDGRIVTARYSPTGSCWMTEFVFDELPAEIREKLTN